MVVEKLAARAGANWRKERDWKAEVAQHGSTLYCKPTSYMNLSGGPVNHVARFYKVLPSEMLVIYDDLAFPLGKLRFRANGSAGGHNGIRSMIEHLGTQEIPRLRFGIGNTSGSMVSHVLGRFSEDESVELELALDRATEAVEFAQTRGLQAAMNHFN
jgi:PTH1 family peptidyl-tRNA hydrolase